MMKFSQCTQPQPHHRKHPCTLVQFHGLGVMSCGLLLYACGWNVSLLTALDWFMAVSIAPSCNEL